MAYVNLVSQSCASAAEAFKRIRDFVCKRNGSYDYSTTGVGWVLHDAVYAGGDQDNPALGDYVVFKGIGEDGLQDIYIRFKWNTATAFDICGYSYWNNTTHTGVNAYQGGANNLQFGSTFPITVWVYGDLDAVILITKSVTTYYLAPFGFMPGSRWPQTITLSTSSVTAGSNKVVSFTSVPADWKVNKYIFVRDNTNLERVRISAINGNDVTFVSFTYGYSSGSKFSSEITFYGAYSNSGTLGMITFMIDHGGLRDSNASSNCSIINPNTADQLEDELIVCPYYFGTSNSFLGPLKNVLVTATSLTAESTHAVGGTTYRYFMNSSLHRLIKEV